MPSHLIDARGLSCPLPVLKARKALLGMAPGERIVLLATDAAACRDVPAYCAEADHALLEASEEPAGVFRFVIARGG